MGTGGGVGTALRVGAGDRRTPAVELIRSAEVAEIRAKARVTEEDTAMIWKRGD